MYAYALLEPECYYIIQENEEDKNLLLIQVKVASDNCMYVIKYGEEVVQQWKKKTDTIYDIIELLGDDAAKKWEDAYFNSQDAYNYEEDED